MFSHLGTILMLHRTSPYEKGGIIYNENLKISPEELDEVISELRRRKLVFVSLDELSFILKRRKETNHRFITFTLDDGYKDNFLLGHDVFKSHNVPYCIYVTNSFPNNTTNLWWYALESLLLQNDFLSRSQNKSIDNRTPALKRGNFIRLRKEILNNHFRDPLSYLNEQANFEFDLALKRQQFCLSWTEIKQLSMDPLVTIGCHTTNHYPLSKLDPHDAVSEIRLSKLELEDRLGSNIKHFAFPFGSKNEAGDREYKIAASMGFETITTTMHSHVMRHDDPQCMGRIFLFPLRDNSTSIEKLFYWNIKSMTFFGKRLIHR